MQPKSCPSPGGESGPFDDVSFQCFFRSEKQTIARLSSRPSEKIPRVETPKNTTLLLTWDSGSGQQISTKFNHNSFRKVSVPQGLGNGTTFFPRHTGFSKDGTALFTLVLLATLAQVLPIGLCGWRVHSSHS